MIFGNIYSRADLAKAWIKRNQEPVDMLREFMTHESLAKWEEDGHETTDAQRRNPRLIAVSMSDEELRAYADYDAFGEYLLKRAKITWYHPSELVWVAEGHA